LHNRKREAKYARPGRNLLELQADKRYLKGRNYWLVLTRPSVAGFNAPIDIFGFAQYLNNLSMPPLLSHL